VLIGDDLDLDMAGRVDEPFQEDPVVAEGLAVSSCADWRAGSSS